MKLFILILLYIFSTCECQGGLNRTLKIGDLHQGLEIIAMVDNKVYLINSVYNSTRDTFNRCKEYCDSNGYTVASTKSLKETQALIDFYRRTFYPYHFWMGMSDLNEEGWWIWLDTLESVGIYSNWAGGQPDGGRDQNCAFFDLLNFQWWDEDCEQKRHSALCQWILE